MEALRDQPAALHKLLDSTEASLSTFNSSFHQNLKKDIQPKQKQQKNKETGRN